MGSDESVVVTAPSVEEAIIVGLTRLVATRDEVEIEILDEGSRGFLGIGAREARVQVVRRRLTGVTEGAVTSPELVGGEVAPAAPATPPVAKEPVAVAAVPAPTVDAPRPAEVQEPWSVETPAPVATPARPDVPRESPKPRRVGQSPVRDGDDAVGQGLDREGLSRLAKEMVGNMLPGMDIEATVEWVDEDRPTLWISLSGHDADALVGPRARNLHALQYLIRALLYHRSDGSYNVVVDADGYRKRRLRSLETMAKSKADQAVAEGRMVRLRAMPPHERRIVHIILREDDRVITESVGKGRDRAVTIVPRSTSESK
ncbi:MAG: Jag N-terminal domain-containing protein [Anaerolineae bacterium]|nr:Jag N-terminal domain-containing protein [Anaerolineae bacterium]